MGNGAANAIKQLRGVKQMSFQSVSTEVTLRIRNWHNAKL